MGSRGDFLLSLALFETPLPSKIRNFEEEIGESVESRLAVSFYDKIGNLLSFSQGVLKNRMDHVLR